MEKVIYTKEQLTKMTVKAMKALPISADVDFKGLDKAGSVDAVLARQSLVESADVNKDGVIDAKDVSAVNDVIIAEAGDSNADDTDAPEEPIEENNSDDSDKDEEEGNSDDGSDDDEIEVKKSEKPVFHRAPKQKRRNPMTFR